MLFLCVFTHVTCSSQEGTEANTCTLVFKLHHIYATGGNKLDQLFTELHSEKNLKLMPQLCGQTRYILRTLTTKLSVL